MAESGAGKLTTHVLDTARGRPAAGLRLALFRLEAGGGREEIARAATNADGRCDGPLLAGEAFRTGTYELVFQAGAYLRETQEALPEPPFLDEVAIRFGMAERTHYHVPLLLSPFGYSTYRGS
jgi:5-hydroxyisourate hydrolase